VAPIDKSVTTAGYVAIALTIGLAGWIRFWINGRRFRRRTIGGGQRFATYGTALFTQLWERVVISLATALMAAAILVGIGLSLMIYNQH
jgi:hypothetical protein